MQKTRNKPLVKATTSSDIIFHILLCAMVDNACVKQNVLGDIDKRFAAFFKTYYEKGATKPTYDARNKILLEAFELEEIQKVKILNCDSTVVHATEKLFGESDSNSIFGKHLCKCNKSNGNIVPKIGLIDLVGGIDATQPLVCTSCGEGGILQLGYFLFIDLKNVEATYGSIPQSLLLHDKVYTLQAIVEVCNGAKHHFVNIRRCNDQFYCFDNKNLKVTVPRLAKRKMLIHMVCYTVSIRTNLTEPKRSVANNNKIDIIQNFHGYDMNGSTITVKMACGPDALLHSLCCIRMDHPHIFSNASHWMKQILFSYEKSDANALYYARIRLLLQKGFEFWSSLTGQAFIDCVSNICNVVSMFGLISVTETRSCCYGDVERNIHLIELDFDILKAKGIKEIQSAIIFPEDTRLVECKKCHFSEKIISDFSDVVYFDLQSVITPGNNMPLPELSLNELPSFIVLGTTAYYLSSVIEYQGRKTQQSHYVAHCYQEGVWSEYNDLAKWSDISDAKAKIRIHLLIFTKKQ